MKFTIQILDADDQVIGDTTANIDDVLVVQLRKELQPEEILNLFEVLKVTFPVGRRILILPHHAAVIQLMPSNIPQLDLLVRRAVQEELKRLGTTTDVRSSSYGRGQ
jgi:hypothetical protein